MTMRVVYLKNHEGHKANKEYYIERTLGRRLCDNGVATPYVTYQKDVEIKKKAEAKAKAKAKVERDEKRKAKEEAKAKRLLEDREKTKAETTISRKSGTRSKAVNFKSFK